MNAWNQTAGVSFVETRGVGKVRISRNQAGYWSYLGTDILHIPNDRPTLNLQGFTINTDEREYRRVVRHEAGRTLGFPHDHMREELVALIDPEKAYDFFLRTQGWSREMVKEKVLTPLTKIRSWALRRIRIRSCVTSFRDRLRETVSRSGEARTSTPPTTRSPGTSIQRSRMRLRHRSRLKWASPTNGRHRKTWKSTQELVQ